MRGALVQALLVGIGGFVGSVLRFTLSGLVQRWMQTTSFPYGTLAVNLSGCLAIGLFAGLAETRRLLSPELRLLLLIGLLGGFTTFSTFGYETLVMLRAGEGVRAVSYVLIHVGAALFAVWAGLALAELG